MSTDLASFMRQEADTALVRSLKTLNLIAQEEGVAEADQKLAREAADHVFQAIKLLKKTKFNDAPSVKWFKKN